jgi:hypothetical protein
MGFPIVTLDSRFGITPVQYNPNGPDGLAPAPKDPGQPRADGTPSNPEFRAFCLANEFPLTRDGLEQAQACTNAWRRAAPAERDAALQRETIVLRRLVVRAQAGDRGAHDELMRIYQHDYALQAPGTGYEPEAKRQRAYTAQLRAHIVQLMANDQRQYAHGHGQNVEWASNHIARELLLQPQPFSPRDPHVTGWLANNPDGNLLHSFTEDVRLVPYLVALHGNAGTNTATVRAAWDHLPLAVATESDDFEARYRATRALIPDLERRNFDSAVGAHLEAQLRSATSSEGQRQFPGADAAIRARLSLVQSLGTR